MSGLVHLCLLLWLAIVWGILAARSVSSLEVAMSLAEVQPGDQGWRRASTCSGGDCLEVAFVGDEVLLRDSKDPSASVQHYSLDEWAAFTGGVKRGEFDVPASP